MMCGGCAARSVDPGGAGVRQLGGGAEVGGDAGRTGDVPGQSGALGHPADNPGGGGPGAGIRGVAEERGGGLGEEEVPGRPVRPAGVLEGREPGS